MNISREQFFGMYEPGSWFRLPRAFLFAPGFEVVDAIILSHLINETYLNWKRIDDGWLPVSRNAIDATLNIKRNQQQLSFARLTKLEVIELRTGSTFREDTARRFIRVNAVKVCEIMQNAPWRSCDSSSVFTDTPSVPTDSPSVSGTSEKSPIDSKKEELRGGFFGRKQPTWDEVAAERLHEAICKARQVHGLPNVRKWPKQFEELRQRGVSKKRIIAAFQFYKTRIGELHVPQIFSAKAFNEKFEQLEMAMEREKPKVEKVELSAITKHILDDLRMTLQWPQVSRDQMPSAVQSSFDDYSAWWLKRRAWLAQNTSDAMARLDQHLCGNFILKPSQFVPQWFRSQHKRRFGWKEWTGRLIPFAVDAVDFNTQGREACQEYSGKADLWEKYLKLIG